MVRLQLVTLPVFSWKTTCLGAILVLAEIAATVITFILYLAAPVRRNTLLFAVLLHFVTIASGALSLARSTPPVVLSLAIAVGTSAIGAIAGGICVIFAVDARVTVANHLDESLDPITATAKDKLVSKAEAVLYCAAITLMLSAGLHAFLAWHLHRIVGEKRGSVAFLQSFSLVALPFSLFLIVGGQYVVDTATLATAPYTGIVIFSSGLLFLTIALLSFIGANFEYRRLLSICYMLSIIVGACFVGLSIAYFAMRNSIHDNIAANWEQIRVVLPPTSRGFYDRDQFEATMRSYLKVVACVGVGAGLFILGEANACMTLLHHTSIGKHLFARDKRAVTAPQAHLAQSAAYIEANKRFKWVMRFASSKRRQRIAMRIAVAIAILAVAFIASLMCASVVFAAQCNSIGGELGSTSFSILNSTSSSSILRLNIDNAFSRGYTTMYPSNDGAVSMKMFGVDQGGGHDFYQISYLEDAIEISASPVDRTRVLWLDGSCQRIAMVVDLPQDTPRMVTVSSNTSVNINYPDPSSTLTILGAFIETDQSPISCAYVDFAKGSVTARSNAGDIAMGSVNINTMGVTGMESSTSLYTALGSISVQNATLLDCDLQIETGAGTIQATAIQSSVFAGRSFVSVKSSSGSIIAEDIDANWIELANGQGSITATSLVSEGSSAFMGRLEVTTISGDITIQQLDASGNVHIESGSGNVKVQLASLTYIGMYYLRSESGNVSIRSGGYSSDVLVETETLSDGRERHGSINCDVESGSCLSFGDLHVRTTLGDIEIVVGCDSFQCV